MHRYNIIMHIAIRPDPRYICFSFQSLYGRHAWDFQLISVSVLRHTQWLRNAFHPDETSHNTSIMYDYTDLISK